MSCWLDLSVMLVLFVALKGKNYYLAPAYPMLFAAGAVAFERITSRRIAWSRPAYVLLTVAVSAILAPLFAPILPVETYIRYQKALGLEPPKSENQRTGVLPQYFADEFGWEAMTQAVAKVYYSLRRPSAPPPPSLRTATDRRALSTSSALNTDCPRRSAAIRTIGIGARAATRARPSSCSAATSGRPRTLRHC